LASWQLMYAADQFRLVVRTLHNSYTQVAECHITEKMISTNAQHILRWLDFARCTV